MEKVGAKIAMHRQRAGLSIADLAKRLSVSSATIHRWEAGHTPITTARLAELADLLGTSVPALLGDAKLIVGNVPPRPAVPKRQSVFISYGGPDEEFARGLNEHLQDAGVDTFFFPDKASPGQRLHRTMSEGVRRYDRVVLICSMKSLSRPGVLNELEQVLQREAEDGGTEVIIPVALDDYVFGSWAPERGDIATQIRGRVIADFRGLKSGSARYLKQVDRLMAVLKRKPGRRKRAAPRLRRKTGRR